MFTDETRFTCMYVFLGLVNKKGFLEWMFCKTQTKSFGIFIDPYYLWRNFYVFISFDVLSLKTHNKLKI